MSTQHSDPSSSMTTPLESLARLYPTSQTELNALDTVRQQYQDGLLTLDEAMRIMEGKQLWQRPAMN